VGKPKEEEVEAAEAEKEGEQEIREEKAEN